MKWFFSFDAIRLIALIVLWLTSRQCSKVILNAHCRMIGIMLNHDIVSFVIKTFSWCRNMFLFCGSWNWTFQICADIGLTIFSFIIIFNQMTKRLLGLSHRCMLGKNSEGLLNIRMHFNPYAKIA